MVKPVAKEECTMTAILDQINRDISEDSYDVQNFANTGERFLAWYLRNMF